jgi:hypothetical protein
VSEHPEKVETPPADGQIQSLATAPVGVSGRIAAAGEEDRFSLDVQPGANLRFDVRAKRLGSPLDALLMIRNEQGGQLAVADDAPDRADSMLDFSVPEGVQKIVVAIKDLRGQGGADYVYHLDVNDLSRPNFSLAFDDSTINLTSGGTQTIKVTAARAGYNGPIELSIPDLPAGVQLGGTRIIAGESTGLLSLTASPGAAFAGVFRILGKSEGAEPITRIARRAESGANRIQPWLREPVGLAAIAEPVSLQLAWASATEGAPLLAGGRYLLKVKMQRAAGAQDKVRIRLLTTQVMPRKKEKQNGQDVEVDDLERAVRLDGAPEFGPETAEAEVELLVPADLPEKEWGLALAADLLAEDNKTVRSTVASATAYLPAVRALGLELSSDPKIEAKAGGGETGQFTGKVLRMTGFNQPVTLTFVGLPADYAAQQLIVPPDQVDFVFPVRFPFEARPADLNVRLKASSLMQPDNEKSRINSIEIPVTIKVVTGEKTEP